MSSGLQGYNMAAAALITIAPRAVAATTVPIARFTDNVVPPSGFSYGALHMSRNLAAG